MVKRIVIMHLMPEVETRFLEIFENIKSEVRSHQGCLGLELLRSANPTELIICTISLWQSADDLETYRASPLFQKTWSEVKPLFASKAQAWTLSSIDHLA